ncbi:hypothetical protein BOTBODRAFT_588044 [Botryobasidium botryosum FD-172 SS1]|uniref:RRM domain-containing protein n=1 Tax=Botryobasidium botryosum (strain FD-172 SS1) TaxID=930990 RepID=A0A067M7S9_BOTB1|nr:hypothetical protein BOTBODRAFT_588044 [Botryobasidium botryosum FD-172 SS1]
MEEGTKNKRTIYVGGLADDVDGDAIRVVFATFGDVIDIQIPPVATNPNATTSTKHRGFAFVTFSSAMDAQDAIDNMDLNEMGGRVLRVNLARPMKGPMVGSNNRAIWESEEWLKANAKPVGHTGVGSAVARAQEALDAENNKEGEGEGEDEAMEE